MPILALYKKNIPLLLLLCGIAFLGCTKDKTTSVTAATYDFSYSGSFYVGHAVSFISTAPSSSSFLWNFGDTTTATNSNPTHAFTKAGIYKVTLIVNSTDTINKTVGIGVDSLQMLLMATSRLWHHTLSMYLSRPWDTTYYYPDVSFSVHVIDAVTVSIGADTLIFATSNDTMFSFEHTFYNPPPYNAYPTGSSNGLSYYTTTNKLRYDLFNHISAGASSDELYVTP